MLEQKWGGASRREVEAIKKEEVLMVKEVEGTRRGVKVMKEGVEGMRKGVEDMKRGVEDMRRGVMNMKDAIEAEVLKADVKEPGGMTQEAMTYLVTAQSLGNCRVLHSITL